MKQSNFLKTLSLLFVVMAMTFAFASCSSDKDEPENPDNSGSGTSSVSMIPYSALPGTWLIESIKEFETGKEISINQRITIGNFQPSQENSTVVTEDGYQFWGQSFDDLISYDDYGNVGYCTPIIGFCKESNKDIKTSSVYTMTFAYIQHGDDAYTTQSFGLSDLHLDGNVLTVKAGAYITIVGINSTQRQGLITMKKL